MLDFPASPTVGQTHPGPAGVLWQYDGQKWANGQTSVGSGVSSWNARTGAVTQTSADVTTALTYTPYNSTNPSGYQTAAQVTATVSAAVRYLNHASNSGFSVNQRGYVSGTALAAGVFGHDRWKAGAGGGTYTFAQSPGPSTTVTITAGTLQQVVEGASLAGGNYMLSWTGTAQGRVGAGSYAASPVAVAGIVAGANTTIEFNAGTLSQVKFETGTAASVWVAYPPRYELSNCQRFYQGNPYLPTGDYTFNAWGPGAWFTVSVGFQVRMRAAPSVISNFTNIGNMSANSVIRITQDGWQGKIDATAAGVTAVTLTSWAASADL